MNSENFIYFVKAFKGFEYAKENMPETTISNYGGGDEINTRVNENDKGQPLNFRSGVNFGRKPKNI